MRFLSVSIALTAFLGFSLPMTISATDIELYFGADFTQSADSGYYVQGGYTVVDNANFVTGLEDNVGTVTKVRWRFDQSPTDPPPTSALIKILQQMPGEQWRFQMVDERLLTARTPNSTEIAADPTHNGYHAKSYVTDVYNFWNNIDGIDLRNLPTNFTLTTPDAPNVAAAPPAIVEHQFVGFYFYDTVSQVAAYSSSPPSDVLEWVMPGNFDWKNTWSPEQRFTFPPGTSGTGFDIATNQIPIPAPSATFSWLNNSDGNVIPGWKQYRDMQAGDFSNFQNNYMNPTENALHWVEGFMARKDHKDFFGFTVEAKSGGGGLGGDPQFAGFQGQNFQFHGMADEVFNLISTPQFQLNGNFKYLSSGNCNYNDTVCWSHPGTYVDQLGFMIGGDIRIKLAAGSHSHGLSAYMNDIELHANSQNKIIFAIANSSIETGSLTFAQAGHVTVDLPQFTIDVTNSDYFFNLEVVFKDQQILRAGRKQVKLRELFLCTSEGMTSADRLKRVETRMADFYPSVPMHGLIGQTWRNVKICDHAWVGDASDYVTSGLFAADSAFNYYGTK